MEAILSRAPGPQLESAAADWLRATHKLARALLRVAGDALVNYSRAGLLVNAGFRPRRRF